ncbi:Probable RNA-directed DNA polymerase from transposon BS [Eumeta japonica]|uniref:Probable RNA-directed DNA polymerase from transposon BS n=1 Tax=Eumeta variegata TaxID=151549 RepID=A0A4C1WKP2_EUMVA|nr:Probable RNA-directed DNA polymerase from transposon BS [Eumeta japonica]
MDKDISSPKRARRREGGGGQRVHGNGLIINEQFGFRPNHYCPQQALRLVEYILEGFKRKCKTVAVFFDVAKAFEKVWHAGLIYKLHQLQIPDRLVFTFHQNLTNRHLPFRHENSISAKKRNKAGVRQGSTLSPLQFLIHKRHPASVNRRPTRALRRLHRPIHERWQFSTNHSSPPEGHRRADAFVPNLENRGMHTAGDDVRGASIRPRRPKHQLQIPTPDSAKKTSAEKPLAHPGTSGMTFFIEI